MAEGHDGPPDSLSEVCTWHCPVCMRTLRAKQFSLLSKKRNGHIRNVHPNMPKSSFHTLRTHYDPVPLPRPVGELPRQGVWICEYCGQGLPSMPEPQKRLSITCHFKQCGQAPRNATRNTNAKKRRRSKAGWMGT